MLLTLSDDVRVILIKLADRLHNMRTLDSMKREKRLKIASETAFLYAPLASSPRSVFQDRVGRSGIEVHRAGNHIDISEKLQQTRRERNKYINEFIEPIRHELARQGFVERSNGGPNRSSRSAVKMLRQGVGFEEIYDIFAIHIIIIDAEDADEKAMCWRCYSIITDFTIPTPTACATGSVRPRLTVTSPCIRPSWVRAGNGLKCRTDPFEAHGRDRRKGYAAQNTKESSGESALDEWIKKIRELLSRIPTRTCLRLHRRLQTESLFG